jgi:DNA-binding NarL/FixJ family response regulator
MTRRQPPADPVRQPAEKGPGPDLRLLVAGSQTAVVEPLGMRLDAEPGFRVMGAVSEPHEALRVARLRPVDVAVLQVDGGVPDFVAIADALRASRPGIALIGLPDREDVPLLERAVRHGFRGWVPMAVGVGTLVEAVRAVHRGESVIPPLLLTRLLACLLEERPAQPEAEAPFAALSPRERQVLREMVRGGNRYDIAEELAISPNTVRTHIQSILAKLEVHSSVAAVTLARRAGLG